MLKRITLALVFALTSTLLGACGGANPSRFETLDDAADAAVSAAEGADGLLSEAKLKYSKSGGKIGHLVDARRLLARAAQLPGGKESFPRALLHSQVALDLHLVEEAYEQARLAENLAGSVTGHTTREDGTRLARSELAKAEAQDAVGRVTGEYGAVTFVPLTKKDGTAFETDTTGVVLLEATSGIIKKDKKEIWGRIKERWDTTEVTLPVTIWLPNGDYLANGVPFKIVAGQPEVPRVPILLQKKGGIPWWGWVAGGAAVVGGIVAAILLTQPSDPAPPRRTEYHFR